MKRHRTFWVLLALLPIAAAAQNQSFTFTARVDRDKVYEGQTLTLMLQISGDGISLKDPLPRPKLLPYLDFMEARTTGRNMQFTIVNGQRSRSTSTTLHYIYAAVKAGTVTIPALTYTDNGMTASTDPITVTVLARPDVMPGSTEWRPPSDPYLEIKADHTEAFIGEQVAVTWFRWFMHDAANARLSKPGAGDYLIEEIFSDVHTNPWTRAIGAMTWYVMPVYSIAVFPIKEGELSVGPLEMLYEPVYNRGFFQSLGNTQSVKSDTAKIKVKPLPLEGQPADFSGAVGRYEIFLDRDTDTIRAGSPFEFTLTVRGDGHTDFITEPKIALPPGFDFYSKPPQKKFTLEKDRLTGSAVYKMYIVPRQTGEHGLGPFTFSYFDPAAAQYRTAQTAPIRLNVLAAEDKPPEAGPDSEEGPSVLTAVGEDFRYIKTGDAGGSGGWVLASPAFAAGQALPLCILAGAFLFARRRDRIASDQGFARRLRASRACKRCLALGDEAASKGNAAEAYAQAYRALAGFISDTFTLPQGLTTADAIAAIKKHGVSEETVKLAENVLDECDRARFAPGTVSAADARAALKRTREAMAAIAREAGK